MPSDAVGSEAALGFIKIRRVLFSVSDKRGIVGLAQAFLEVGAELVATGKTALELKKNKLPVTEIQEISKTPEAFQGRMKTLSFPVCGGILYRRGDILDEADLKKLDISPIDAVVVNFYPFQEAVKKNLLEKELIEQIDIGGPTLVRAAAKNFNHVLVLTDPTQYQKIIDELKTKKAVSIESSKIFAQTAWDHVLSYDEAIALEFGKKQKLRYGENPHQEAWMRVESNSPIAWDKKLTSNELSYNNLLDVGYGYSLLSDLVHLFPNHFHAVIIKHNNPCGVAVSLESQKIALMKAWEGDPVSSFGGVVLLSKPLDEEVVDWLSDRFIELVGALDLSKNQSLLDKLLSKRKKLKAIEFNRVEIINLKQQVLLPGARLIQDSDSVCVDHENFKSVTKRFFPEEKWNLARFGISVTRALKSNAVSLVREIPGQKDSYQLVGAGQGQPNRVDALEKLAIPRAQAVLRETGGQLEDCILVSDAFFPFPDAIEVAHASRIGYIVQPGGSIKDLEVIEACNKNEISMVFTGMRHFRH